MTESMSPNALTIVEKRYLHRDPETNEPIEDVKGMFERVARYMALAEHPADVDGWFHRFFNLLASRDFLPNTPALVNAGKGLKDSGMSACFVLPIEDDMEKIYTTVRDAAIVFKSGGGVGYSFSRLRPKGDRVKTTGGVAGGPIAFMEQFHTMAKSVKQGSVRPGAQMAILRCDHPDIEEFVTCKTIDKALSSFNISVGITDAFMHAVENDHEFNLINPRNGAIAKTIKARELWTLIVTFAHKTGDPGLFFLDEANRYNPTPKLGDYESTNPCGEVVLLAGEPCNLGSITVSHFAVDINKGQVIFGDPNDPMNHIDHDRLRDVVHTSVRFLDNVISMNAYPVELIKQMALGNRKIGLGIMGWADLLVDLGIPYNSPKAVKFAEDLMRFIHDESYNASENLASERGCFPNWEESELNKDTEVWGKRRKQRNSTKLTIAPTGSISGIADCSSGIEPYFALAYQRLSFNETTTLFYFNDRLAKHLAPIFNDEEQQAVAAELSTVGSLRRLSAKWLTRIPSHVLDLFETANDLSPEAHVLMQAAFQKYVDSSISKTINMKKDVPVEAVGQAYWLAWKAKCKGITVYRDGSRTDQPLSTGESAAAKEIEQEAKIGPRPRQHAMHGTTRMIPTGCGPLVVTINSDEHGIAEVIAKGGKSGGCVAAQVEAIGRLASLAMRSGVPKEKVISQLGGIQCHLPTFYPGQPQNHNRVTSCADAIATAMIEAVYEQEHVTVAVHKTMGLQGSCPDCGGSVTHDSGCVKCINPSCGWSKC